ncbi:tetratricopeptide repeat protein [Bradyrhizobium sp. WD16]|uniref:tetratricopeptide repeat protein n=1 Tax=Bradyrhizobium sp. WD16 TaxID=1521768 RepID=UPI0020A4B8B3|nr:tetratricopeptide repeat protein [Bradyrhizobium sp. WD16]
MKRTSDWDTGAAQAGTDRNQGHDSGPTQVSTARIIVAAVRRSSIAALAACGLLLSLISGEPAHAQQAIRGEASFSAGGGYARLVLKLAEDVDTDVSVAGSVLIIRFRKPVDVPIDPLATAVPDYVGSARRDPDGMAIRLALARKVTVNAMDAGERTFIDLMPEGWTGPPPSLPQEVVRELAERAREAERLLRQQKAATEVKKRPPVRVRASTQPTFVRFVFDLPPGIGVSSSLEDKKLSLVFNAPLSFDLTDAKLAAPPSIMAIEQKLDPNGSLVSFAIIGEVDVHSFREDANYVVDIGFDKPGKPPLAAVPDAQPEQKPAAKSDSKSDAGAATKGAVALASKGKGSGEVNPAADLMAEIKTAAEAAPKIAPPAVVAPVSAEPSKVPVTGGEQAAIDDHRIDAARAQPARAAAVAKPDPVRAGFVPPVAIDGTGPERADASPTAAKIKVVAQRSSDGLRLIFPFRDEVPVALFRRGDAMWLVLDTMRPIDTEAIRRDGGAVIGDVTVIQLANGQAIRIRLTRPQLAGISADAADVTVVFADVLDAPSRPLTAIRNIADPGRAHVSVSLPHPGIVHRILDPDAGDALTVVTAPLPARGFVRRQNFVEFSLLETIHGVVVLSAADDLAVTTAPDKVMLTRPGGLILSSAELAPKRDASGPKPLLDAVEWRANSEAVFAGRVDELIAAAARGTGEARARANLDLARFYLARGFYPEARAAAALALAGANPGFEDPAALILRAAAAILSNRPEAGLKDLANPVIASSFDLEVWKGLAYARQKKWPEAREKFKNAEFAIAALPEELQRIILSDAMQACLEVHDYDGASARSNDLGVLGVTEAMKPMVSVMRAQLAEALGREKEALAGFDEVAASSNLQAATKARLRTLLLRQKRHEIDEEQALKGLETLAVTWRGDDVELEILQQLTRMYATKKSYNDALAAARLATRLQPNSEIARDIQTETSALFVELFLGPKADALPPIEALGMFYDYRELTPIGRRGDEMIRRLAERLVGVDLLDQAADLLQYQVDHRLEGAARAQVASRLATIYLMNRKPDRAIGVLRATRIADLSGELRQQRLLLEARAQSDLGRHDLALDIISNLTGREVTRLRSDIFWAARRWRESAEQIELYYGDRWKEFQPLNPAEKGDIIRAAIGYALAEDALGLGRFREKYGPKMSEGTDRIAFDTASKPAAATSAEFAQIARMAASVDTLEGFLREMKGRFPEMSRAGGAPDAAADAVTTGALPRIRSVAARQ